MCGIVTGIDVAMVMASDVDRDIHRDKDMQLDDKSDLSPKAGKSQS